MSNSNTHKLIFAALILLLSIVISGCGGGNKSASSVTGSGRVQLTIDWPAKLTRKAGDTRYIPAYAQSLYFELYRNDTPDRKYQLTLNRPSDKPSTQTGSFDRLLLAGDYTLAGVARTEKDGQGGTVASSAVAVLVKPNETATAALILLSTIKTLQIQGQPLSVASGSLLSLTGKALDPDGKTILLPVGALTWKLISGDAFATLASDGAFTAKAQGVAHVRLSEEGAGVSAEADVTISASNGVVSGLAKSSWPKWGGDAANTGRGGGSGAIGTLAWKFGTLASPAKNIILSNPPSIGSDGTLFQSYLDNVTGEFRIAQINGMTGGLKQGFPLPESSYFKLGQPTLGADGTLYIGVVLIDSSRCILALDSVTGALKWKFKTPEKMLSSASTPEINIGSDGTIYVNSLRGFYALDSKTGLQKWTVDSQSTVLDGVVNPPAIGLQNAIYFGNHELVTAVDGITGSVLWRVSSPSAIAGVFSAPAVGPDGTVYTRHSGIPSILYAFDGRTGAKKWEFTVSSTTDISKGSPAIGADGTVYAVGVSLFAINPNDGTMKWTSRGFATEGTTPVIGSDGTIYAGSTGAIAFNASDGSVKFTAVLPGVFSSSFGTSLGSDGSIYVAGDSNTLYGIH